MPLSNLQNLLQNPPGRIPRLEDKVAVLWNAIVGIEWEDSISVRETAQGSFCIGGGGFGGGGGIVVLTGFKGTAKPIMKTEQGHTDEVDHFEVRVLGGTVQGVFGVMELIETTYYVKSGTSGGDFENRWPDYNDGNDEKKTATIPDREIFWLEYDPNANEGQRWSLEHDDKLPASVTQPPASESNDDNTRYFSIIPLFRVEYKKTEDNVNQWHAGSVFVPTATNVVEIQQPAQSAQQGAGE